MFVQKSSKIVKAIKRDIVGHKMNVKIECGEKEKKENENDPKEMERLEKLKRENDKRNEEINQRKSIEEIEGNNEAKYEN